MDEVLGERTHVARKQHGCEWCGQAIMPGERYHVWVGRDEGTFATYKSHMECEEAIDESLRTLDPEEIDWGSLHERGVAVTQDEWT